MSIPASNAIKTLLQVSLPLIPKYGFTVSTLSQASLSLPSPYTPTKPYSLSTISALFPSSPISPPLIRTRKSLSRQEIIADAQDQANGIEREQRQQERRVGPRLALVEAWLGEGRRSVEEKMKKEGLGEKEGIKLRMRYNESVLELGAENLREALGLLKEESILSPVTPLQASPSYLAHIADIGHSIAQGSLSEAQGTDWYTLRTRLSTIYGLAELHLLTSNIHLPPRERIESAEELIDTLFESTDYVGEKLGDATMFGGFVVRSWMGLFRSVGV